MKLNKLQDIFKKIKEPTKRKLENIRHRTVHDLRDDKLAQCKNREQKNVVILMNLLTSGRWMSGVRIKCFLSGECCVAGEKKSQQEN